MLTPAEIAKLPKKADRIKEYAIRRLAGVPLFTVVDRPLSMMTDKELEEFDRQDIADMADRLVDATARTGVKMYSENVYEEAGESNFMDDMLN